MFIILLKLRVYFKRLLDKKNIKIIKNSSINSFVDIDKTVLFKKIKMIKNFDLLINTAYSNLNNHIYHLKISY